MTDIFDTFTIDDVQFAQFSPDTELTHVLPENVATLYESQLGIVTISQWLEHYPRKYRETGDWGDPNAMMNGQIIRTTLTVTEKYLRSFKQGKMAKFRRKYLKVHGLTPNGVELSFMCFDGFTANKNIHIGNTILVSGELEQFGNKRGLKLQDYETDTNLIHRPVRVDYPATKKLDKITQETYAPSVLENLAPLPEHLPADIVQERNLYSYDAAMRLIHQPQTMQQVTNAKVRLAYDEAFATQLVLVSRRTGVNQQISRQYPVVEGGLRSAFDALLPYELTEGQAHAGALIEQKMAGNTPMNSLVLGDVGSGKTTVGNRALLQVVDGGGQGAFIAPTEVLAEQHYKGLTHDFSGVDVNVALLTGNLPEHEKRQVLADIAAGRVDIVVGTHAIFSATTEFKQLGLVVIDEGHRFGVEQRDALRSRYEITPHMMVMTATPIPRTIAMLTYGDLDVYELKGVPAGRKPISTVVTPLDKPAWVQRVWSRITEEISTGRQVFLVASLIEHPRTDTIIRCEFPGYTPDATVSFALSNSAGEQVRFMGKKGGKKGSSRIKANAAGVAVFEFSTADLEAGQYTAHATAKGTTERNQSVFVAEDTGSADNSENQHETDGETEGQTPRPPALTITELAQLVHQNVPDARVGIMHGKLDAEQKNAVMEQFSAGELDVLVSTTVIEVGVNVPNATVMGIWDADRFGAAQLHQLRGRVGRGQHPGLCLLVTSAPEEHPSRERLDAVASTTDGYEIAQKDLELRREGDILGNTQSGRNRMKHLTLKTAEPVIRAAREDAELLLNKDPALRAHPGVKQWLMDVLTEEERTAITRS